MRRYQLLFFCSGCALSVIGICFIYSAGTYWGNVHYEHSTPFYIKQLLYLVVAVALFLTFASKEFLRQERFWILCYIVSLVLLLALYVPGLGVVRNGSRSWLNVGIFTLQPAEVVKVTTLIYLSFVLAKVKSGERIVKLSHFIIILLPVGLIMLQPDFGSAFILIVSALALMFIANYPLKLFVTLIVAGAGALTILIATAPYRLKRIQAFLDPWEDALGSGFQAVQSLLAIGPAGLFGHGYLKSRQKYLYLPEPQNDFIFSIILEEIGFIGGVGLLLIFACFLYSAYQLAFRTVRTTAFYIIASLTTMLGIQISLNIGVVIGLLPVTGVTLPFISYGGSSLVLVWLVMTIIFSFSKGFAGKGE